MRSAIKLAYSMGSVAMILSGAALSAPPTAFGQYIGAGATITPTGTGGCPAGFTCQALSAAISGLGFLQREIVDATGAKYIHTIIDDNKGFKTEDFVKFNLSGQNAAKGIASRSSITETAADGTIFKTGADILTGWGATDQVNNKSEALLSFSLDKPSVGGLNDKFFTSFNATVATRAGATAGTPDINVTERLAIDQTVGLEGPAGSTDRQRFYTAIQPANNALTAYKIPGGVGPGVTVALKSPVQIVWVGQTVTGAGSFGTTTLSEAKADGTGGASFLTNTTLADPTFTPEILKEFFTGNTPVVATPVF